MITKEVFQLFSIYTSFGENVVIFAKVVGRFLQVVVKLGLNKLLSVLVNFS